MANLSEQAILNSVLNSGGDALKVEAEFVSTSNNVELVNAAGSALIGQALMAASIPVTVASNQSALTVTGTITGITNSVTVAGPVTNAVLTDIADSTNHCIATKDKNISALRHGGLVTVTTAGTAVPLTTTSYPCDSVLIVTAATNTGSIYVADAAVNSSDCPIPASTIMAVPCTNASLVYLNASLNVQAANWQPIA
jgi:hypothetical protein